VNQVSFSIQPGEIVGFLGPNGAGKSTTMKMITGYLPSDSGSIEVCGIPVDPAKITSKKKIGYLPEANPLYYDMYVREYLRFIGSVHGISSLNEAVETVIRTVGLTPEAHKKTGQLSKGYKQRVGLAAALIHNPDVLILDEPTSGLDPNQIVEIREVIRTLAPNKTILFSSHILQEVEALCNRVIIINRGNIVADEQLEDLRRMASDATALLVVFNAPIDISLLQKIDSVESVSAVKESAYHIHCNQPEQVKKEILRISIAHNLDIVSLQNQANSLENIFKSLTS
ncbi:MAG TPA: ATP-binding cassette domain-containing protein, partial [Ferruginibacter sp.]|nr:ATP-binding cassette domain-containing protein [Ferruginibacter sp.]